MPSWDGCLQSDSSPPAKPTFAAFALTASITLSAAAAATFSATARLATAALANLTNPIATSVECACYPAIFATVAGIAALTTDPHATAKDRHCYTFSICPSQAGDHIAAASCVTTRK